MHFNRDTRSTPRDVISLKDNVFASLQTAKYVLGFISRPGRIDIGKLQLQQLLAAVAKHLAGAGIHFDNAAWCAISIQAQYKQRVGNAFREQLIFFQARLKFVLRVFSPADIPPADEYRL